jgi:hypothetical protein
MIPLRPVDSSNYRERIELAVAPDQERFVASNVQSLAEAYVWREGAEPFARTAPWSASRCSSRSVRASPTAPCLRTARSVDSSSCEFYCRNDFVETGELHGGELVVERQV